MRASVEAEKAAAAKREETHAAEIAKASAAAKAASDRDGGPPESVRARPSRASPGMTPAPLETIAALRANGLTVARGTHGEHAPGAAEARATPTTAASAETSATRTSSSSTGRSAAAGFCRGCGALRQPLRRDRARHEGAHQLSQGALTRALPAYRINMG